MEPNEKDTPSGAVKTSTVDALTVQAARGLVLAQGALEVVARWLDARAKDAGELAAKLSSTGASEAPTEPSTEPSA